MSEINRVQRWRQQQREAGKDALTIWLPRELKLYLEDIALKRHCSPSDLIEQALTTCYPLNGDVTGTVTDTSVTDMSQLRMLLQQELRSFFGESPLSLRVDPAHHVTVTVTDTDGQAAPGGALAPEIPRVTDTVTDTVTVTVTDTDGQTENENTAGDKAQHVTDTVTDTESVTDTVTVTGHARAPFDTTRYYLGALCPQAHNFGDTGQSLRRKHNKSCRDCENDSKKARRQARRQEVPA